MPSVLSLAPLVTLARDDGTIPTATACSFPVPWGALFYLVPDTPSVGLGLVLPQPCSLGLRLLPHSTLGIVAWPPITVHPHLFPFLSSSCVKPASTSGFLRHPPPLTSFCSGVITSSFQPSPHGQLPVLDLSAP